MQWTSNCPGKHLPAAAVRSFLPVVAAAVTLRAISELVEALLAHVAAGQPIPGLAAACVQQAGRMLGSVDHLIRELSEVALVIFGCAHFGCSLAIRL